MNHAFSVYKITNKINGKVYIGKTNNPKKRWNEHKSTSKKVKGHKDFSLIHKAIQKYGDDCFTFEVIKEFKNESQAYNSEKYWIKRHKSYVGDYGHESGYNLTPGGDGMQSGALSGIRNPKAKLSNNDTLAIQTSKFSTKQLCLIYGVSRTTIQRIRSGKTWSHMATKMKKPKAGFYYDNRSGENSCRAKLTWKKVEKIRAEFKNNAISIASLSRKYNVSWFTIKCIVTNITWKI